MIFIDKNSSTRLATYCLVFSSSQTAAEFFNFAKEDTLNRHFIFFFYFHFGLLQSAKRQCSNVQFTVELRPKLLLLF